MDLGLLKKDFLDYTKKRKKSVLLLGLLGLTCYTTYRVNRKRQRLFKLFGALVSVAEMVSESAEAIGTVSKDVKEFIQSDSDQIPLSLKQVSKISSSNEFSESLSRITRALTIGVLRGYNREVIKSGGGGSFGGETRFSDRVIDKLFSDTGSGFASVVVGSLARNVVIALYSDTDKGTKSGKGSGRNGPSWIEVACQDKNREIIRDWIRSFVDTAVTVYLDKTMDVNTYDEIFAGLTNPKHEPRVRDMLVNVCNGAVETYIRRSQRVGAANSDGILSSAYSKFDFCEKSGIGTKLISATLHGKKLVNKNQDGGWVNKMSSTLAVPSNRKLILDMTGMLTFETIRSFLEFLFEKLAECAKRSVDVANREVVERGVEAMRYVSCRSSAVATICLSLCLHTLNGPWILAPTDIQR